MRHMQSVAESGHACMHVCACVLRAAVHSLYSSLPPRSWASLAYTAIALGYAGESCHRSDCQKPSCAPRRLEEVPRTALPWYPMCENNLYRRRRYTRTPQANRAVRAWMLRVCLASLFACIAAYEPAGGSGHVCVYMCVSIHVYVCACVHALCLRCWLDVAAWFLPHPSLSSVGRCTHSR